MSYEALAGYYDGFTRDVPYEALADYYEKRPEKKP